jgi:PAS domain S-box-containing protein
MVQNAGIIAQTFLKLSNEMFFALDTDKKITGINPSVSRLLGYEPDKINGKDVAVIFRDQAFLAELFTTLGTKPFTPRKETELVSETDDNLPALLAGAVCTDESGKTVGYMIVAADLSDYKMFEGEVKIGYDELMALNSILTSNKNDLEESNTKLVKIDKLKNNFLSMVSHELRTPLTAIIGFVKFIENGAVGPVTPKQTELIGLVNNNLERLLKLINELLDMSKMESGTFSINRTICDLTDTISVAVNDISPIAQSRNINLIKEFGAEKVMINMDAYRISQVIINLLNNSIKFSPKGANIWIKVRLIDFKEIIPPVYVSLEGLKQCRYYKVTVEDEGIGIPEGMHEKVFEKFFQIKKDTYSKPKGVGLGLPITREIIGMHGGRIWAQPTAEGHGAEFIFIIPAE